MANVVLFHSIMGLRPGVREAAARLRQAGHQVCTPDLFAGAQFTDMELANQNLQKIGFPEVLARSQAAVAALPDELVYAGFSLGGVAAEMLAAKRPGAKGCILFHSALPFQALKVEAWPATVPVQVHFAQNDPWRKQEAIDALAASVRQSGAAFAYYEYPGSGHLFADPDLPDYHPGSAVLMWERTLEFLRQIPATE